MTPTTNTYQTNDSNDDKDPLRLAGVIVFDIETTGLDPFSDRITAIGTKTVNGLRIFMCENEADTLSEFWSYLHTLKNFKLVGFNSDSFDLPFLYIRSLHHSKCIRDVRYKSVDLRRVLTLGNKYAKGKLDDFATLIGLPNKLYQNISPVELWELDKDKLKEYLERDLEITWSLFIHAKICAVIE